MATIYDWIVSFWGEDAPNTVRADDIYMEQQPTSSTLPGNKEAKDEWTWVETISDESSESTIVIQSSRIIDGNRKKVKQERRRALRQLFKQLPRTVPQPAGKLLTPRDRRTAFRLSSERNELQMVRYSKGLARVPQLAHSSDADIMDMFLQSKPVLKFFFDLNIQQNPDSSGYDIDALLKRLLDEYRRNTKTESQPKKVMGLIEWKKDEEPEAELTLGNATIPPYQAERMPSWIPVNPSNKVRGLIEYRKADELRDGKPLTAPDQNTISSEVNPPRYDIPKWMTKLDVFDNEQAAHNISSDFGFPQWMTKLDLFDDEQITENISTRHDVPKWMAKLDVFGDEDVSKNISSHHDIPRWMAVLDVFNSEESLAIVPSQYDIPDWMANMNLIEDDKDTTPLQDIPDWMKQLNVFEDPAPRSSLSPHHFPEWIRRMDVFEGEHGVEITSYYDIPQWIKRINVFEDEDELVPLGTESPIDQSSDLESRENSPKSTQPDDHIPLEADVEWFEMSEFWRIPEAPKNTKPSDIDIDLFNDLKAREEYTDSTHQRASQDDYHPLDVDEEWFEMSEFWNIPDAPKQEDPSAPWDCEYFRTGKLSPSFYKCLLSDTVLATKWVTPDSFHFSPSKVVNDYPVAKDALSFGSYVSQRANANKDTNNLIDFGITYDQCDRSEKSVVDFGLEWDIYENSTRASRRDIDFALEWSDNRNIKRNEASTDVDFGITRDLFEQTSRKVAFDNANFGLNWDIYEHESKSADNNITVDFGIEWDNYEREREATNNSMVNFCTEWDNCQRDDKASGNSCVDFGIEWDNYEREREPTNSNDVDFGIEWDNYEREREATNSSNVDFAIEWDNYEREREPTNRNDVDFGIEWDNYEREREATNSNNVDFGIEWDNYEREREATNSNNVDFGIEWDIFEQEMETMNNNNVDFGIEWDNYEQEMGMEINSSTDFNQEWEYQESLMAALRELNRVVEEDETQVTDMLVGKETSDEGKTKLTKKKPMSRFAKSISRKNVSKEKARRSASVKKFARHTRKTQKKRIQLNQPIKKF